MSDLTEKLIDEINQRMARAHTEHGPLDCDMKASGVITEEYHEVIEAIRGGETWKIRAELLDLANGCVRGVLAIDADSELEARKAISA